MNTWLKVVFIHCVNTQPDKVFSYTVHTLVDLVVWTTGRPSCGPHYVYKCVHLCSPCIRVFCVHSDPEHKVYTVVYNGGEASCGPHLGRSNIGSVSLITIDFFA